MVGWAQEPSDDEDQLPHGHDGDGHDDGADDHAAPAAELEEVTIGD
jgi:hypothetical protein